MKWRSIKTDAFPNYEYDNYIIATDGKRSWLVFCDKDYYDIHHENEHTIMENVTHWCYPDEVQLPNELFEQKEKE